MKGRTKWGSPLRAPRGVSTLKPDGSLDLDEPVGKEFEQVLESLSDLHTGKMRNRPREHRWEDEDPVIEARDREEFERLAQVISVALHTALAEKLQSQGIVIAGVGRDKRNEFVLRVFAADDHRRPCDVTLEFSDVDHFLELRQEQEFRKLVDRAATQMLAARDAQLAEQRAFEAKVQRVQGN